MNLSFMSLKSGEAINILNILNRPMFFNLCLKPTRNTSDLRDGKAV